MREIVIKLRSLLSRRDKIVLVYLLIFSIVVSLIETIGVGVIMPFISVATDFDNIGTNRYLKAIYEFFGFSSPLHFVVAFGMALVVFYIVRAILNYLYFYALARFSMGRYHLLAFRLFENYIGLPYRDFIDKNTAQITKNIVNEADNLVKLISNVLFILSEVFVIIFIYSFLLYINWKMTLLLTLFLGLNVLILKFTVSKRIKREGELRERAQQRFYDILSSALGNIKMVKLRGSEKKILKAFSKASYDFSQANITNQSLSQVPRLFLEAIGFSLIAIIVIYLVLKYQTDIKAVLPILMAFVLGLYRLMPSVNRIISAYNQILFYARSLHVIHNELIYESEDLGDEEIEFNDKIELKNVDFSYTENRPILQDVNLIIKKGEKVGIVGESGSGKSTLIDLLVGLYRPKSGKILIDGVELSEKNLKSWRRKIGYIPQNIYLFDGTVAENVAFGEIVDERRVKEALKRANLLEFLEREHEGIYTRVGENGVKLSGGQKQRVAIARAIYFDPEILVLDEATSALDNETEKKIMDEIYALGKDKTMIIVAHRISTLDRCDKIIRLIHGYVERNI